MRSLGSDPRSLDVQLLAEFSQRAYQEIDFNLGRCSIEEDPLFPLHVLCLLDRVVAEVLKGIGDGPHAWKIAE